MFVFPGKDIPVEEPVNGTAILPVNLRTPLDRSRIQIIWERDGTLVHIYTKGNPPNLRRQLDKDYENRASLFEDKIADGNVSLKLTEVTEKDAGVYICTVVTKANDKKIVNTSTVSLGEYN